MVKSETTKKLEKLLADSFDPRNNFYAFECTLGWYGKEIVDCMMYHCNRDVYCYEIKSSLADFHSKSAKTFVGNKNYYVMPLSVYEVVKDEIPDYVGVYVSIGEVKFEETRTRRGVESKAVFVDGFEQLNCIKHCKRVDLRADKEVILSSLLRCVQRDYYRGERFAY